MVGLVYEGCAWHLAIKAAFVLCVLKVNMNFQVHKESAALSILQYKMYVKIIYGFVLI